MMVAEKFWRFIDSQFQAIAILITVLLVLLGVWLHASLEDWKLAAITGMMVFGLVIFDFYFTKEHAQRMWMREREVFIRTLLEAAAFSILRASRPPVEHVRASLMFPDAKNNLVIRYQFGFEKGDWDRNIKIPIGTGSAGQSWLQGKPMVADLSESHRRGVPPMWGIPFDELEKVRPSLKSVLSVPIRGGEDFRVVAILNFDTDNSVEDIGFTELEIQNIGYAFAKVLSDLLENTSQADSLP